MARILVVIVLIQTAVFAVRPVVTYRTLELGGGAAQVGLSAGALGLAAVVLAIPAGRWVDRFGEVRFIVGGCAVSAVAVLATQQAGSVPALVAAQMVLGAGHIVAVVAIQAWVANRAGDGRRERDFAALTIAVSIAAVIGPALLGLLTSGTASTPSQAEVTRILWVAVATAVLAGAAGSHRVRQSAPPSPR